MDDRQERLRRREGTRAEALAAQDEIAAQRRAERQAARAKEDALDEQRYMLERSRIESDTSLDHGGSYVTPETKPGKHVLRESRAAATAAPARNELDNADAPNVPTSRRVLTNRSGSLTLVHPPSATASPSN